MDRSLRDSRSHLPEACLWRSGASWSPHLAFSEVGTTKKAISTVPLRNGFVGSEQRDPNLEALAVLGHRRDVWKKRVAQEYGDGED